MITKVHQQSFLEKIRSLDLHDCFHTPRGSQLKHLLKQLDYQLHIFTHLLNNGLQSIQRPIEQIRILELGAGNGLLALFARHAGFQEVYINDIDPLSIQSCQALSQKMNLHIRGYITGDADAVISFFKHHPEPDLIIGHDMIEHVYDPERFFTDLHQLSSVQALIFSTASNPQNWLKVRRLRQYQYTDEYIGHPDAHPDEPHQPTPIAFLEMRKTILREHAPLSNAELTLLAQKTRGQRKDDILRSLELYRTTGTLPTEPDDPYNTCEPLTGSWCERILPLETYYRLFELHGFSLQISPGFYNRFQPFPKSMLLSFLNWTMPLTGLRLAPFIVLKGTCKPSADQPALS